MTVMVPYRPALPLRGYNYKRFGALGVSATSTIGTAAKGASTGATAGSYFPVIGTVVGAAVGAIIGIVAGSIGKQDPEAANFNQAADLYRSQGSGAVLNIPNKYLALAGLFDLHPSQIKGNIPIYKKYGRMGEERFVNDLCNLIQAAAQSGRITGNDTPLTIKQNIVQPWIDSFGYGSMADSNAGMIDTLILGMIAEYVMHGNNLWVDVKGNPTFKNLPPFALPYTPPPAPVAQPPAVIPVPSPMPQPTIAQMPVIQVQPPAVPPTVVGTTSMGTPAVAPDQTAALIQQLMAQGASQQQAFQAALASLQSQGVPPTPQVQQQVAADVSRAGGPPSGTMGKIVGVVGILAFLGFALMRPKPKA